MNAVNESPKTIVVGMSGGVDSSVAALLLKQQGHRVIGLFMKNWEETDENGVCTTAQDYEDVKRVCEKLDIPYYAVEFVNEYRDQVFKDFLHEYQAGYTPNPDVLCNREIKFKIFYDKAMELGADYLATGHYCQITQTPDGPKLARAIDQGKDQTYFLNAISGDVLNKVLFPIGNLPKSEVRRLALENDLATAKKKDSTGICFIGERNFRPFLKQFLSSQPGEIRLLDDTVVGKHSGSIYFTLGQRKGLGLGGEGEPWFIVKKDTLKNILYVERGEEHPALYADTLTAENVNWINTRPAFPLKITAKSRYRQSDQPCTVYLREDGKLHVEFHIPQRALTPGQYVVFYDGEFCLGGARISAVGPSYHDQKRALKLTTKDTQVQLLL